MSEEGMSRAFEPMSDEELNTIFKAVAWRVEAASKSSQGEWPDRAAVVGRMTYSAERLLREVRRLREALHIGANDCGGSTDYVAGLHERIRGLEAALKAYDTAIDSVRSRYTEEVFPPGFDSPDAKAASMARRTCDNIKERARALSGEIRDRWNDKPKVVCLCGSTRFKDAYARENRRLTLEGSIVLSVALFAGSGDVVSDEQKEALDELHLRKIDLADEVRVVGDGYVGESTKKEIEYAKGRGKPVVFCCGEAPDTEEAPSS